MTRFPFVVGARKNLAMVAGWALVATLAVSGSATLGEPPATTQATPAMKAGELSVAKIFAVGGEGRWDYLCADAQGRRLYVPRSTHVQVLDLDTGKVLGDIAGTNGVHGVALAPEQGLGFTSNGKDNAVSVFDLKTLQVSKTIKTGKNPDAILFDPASKHIMAFNHSGGDVTVIDPAALDQAPVTIEVGGKLEYAASNEAGRVFVCVEDTNEVVVIDSKTNKVTARWTLGGGEGPTGLAIDLANHRLFAGCGNQKMVVLDSQTGKVLATPEIGKGVDGVAFEPTLKAAVSANGKDGTASVVQEKEAGKFEVVATVKTLPGARTIAADTKMHQLVMPCNVPDGKGGQTFGIVVVGAGEAKK